MAWYTLGTQKKFVAKTTVERVVAKNRALEAPGIVPGSGKHPELQQIAVYNECHGQQTHSTREPLQTRP